MPSMTRPTGNNVKRVTVTLLRKQTDVLASIATREDVSVAWLVRKAVDRFIREGTAVRVGNHAKRSAERK